MVDVISCSVISCNKKNPNGNFNIVNTVIMFFLYRFYENIFHRNQFLSLVITITHYYYQYNLQQYRTCHEVSNVCMTFFAVAITPLPSQSLFLLELSIYKLYCAYKITRERVYYQQQYMLVLSLCIDNNQESRKHNT